MVNGQCSPIISPHGLVSSLPCSGAVTEVVTVHNVYAVVPFRERVVEIRFVSVTVQGVGLR
jgi:hypothetical protein